MVRLQNKRFLIFKLVILVNREIVMYKVKVGDTVYGKFGTAKIERLSCVKKSVTKEGIMCQ